MEEAPRKKSIFGRVFGSQGAPGTPTSTGQARSYNGADEEADVARGAYSQTSGAEDITPKAPNSIAGTEDGVVQRGPSSSPAAGQNSTLAAALAEANSSAVAHDSPQRVVPADAAGVERPNSEVAASYSNSWQYAAEMTRKAEMEAQHAELKSQEAYKWATEAATAQKEAEAAHARYDRAKARLRALEEEKVQIADRASALDRSHQAIRGKEADMQVLQRDAERAAELARAKYDEAKQQREVAELHNQTFKQLEQQHLSTLDKLKEVEAQMQQLHLDHQQHAERLEQGRGSVERHQRDVGAAYALVEQKRRELAEAEAAHQARQSELSVAARAANEHEEALAAKRQERDSHESTVSSTRANVSTLAEQRETAGREAAESSQLIREKADAAKVERERALAQKAQVDNALAELEAQRAAHAKQETELQEARTVAERNAANIQPVRDEANSNARRANDKYAEAQQKSEAWLKAKSDAQEHKGRWSDYWNKAKHAGDQGHSESTSKFKSLEDKLAEVGQGLKEKLSPRHPDEHTKSSMY